MCTNRFGPKYKNLQNRKYADSHEDERLLTWHGILSYKTLDDRN